MFKIFLLKRHFAYTNEIYIGPGICMHAIVKALDLPFSRWRGLKKSAHNQSIRSLISPWRLLKCTWRKIWSETFYIGTVNIIKIKINLREV